MIFVSILIFLKVVNIDKNLIYEAHLTTVE